MDNHPYQREPGVLYAPVATDLPAGLRSLISELQGQVPPRLGRWAIPVRLGVAAACFAGGCLCARLFVECLLGDTRMCPCVLPPDASYVALALGLPALYVVSIPASAATAPGPHRDVPAWALPGLRQPLPTCRGGTRHG